MSTATTAPPHPDHIAFADVFVALAAPFDSSEIRFLNKGGRELGYITARTVCNRLDDVLGPAGWWDEYRTIENGVICRLTLRMPDGSLLTKEDAGGDATMPDAGDNEKAAFSDALKRAAAKVGVARYLYRDGVPWFVSQQFNDRAWEVGNNGPSRQQAPGGQRPSQGQQAPPRQGGGNGQQGGQNGPPRTGPAMYAWTKKQEEENCAGLLKSMNAWAKLEGFPFKMTEWSTEEVARGHAYALTLTNPKKREPGDDDPGY